MAIGFQGPGGTEGAYAALQRLVDDARTRKLLEERLKEGEFRRGFDTRKQSEIERGNLVGEDAERQRLGFDGRRVVLLEKADQRAETTHGRGITKEDKAEAALDELQTGITDPALAQSFKATRHGVAMPRNVFLTPVQRGGEKGAEDLAAFQGGGETVKKGETAIDDNSAFARIAATGAEQRRNIAASGAEQRATDAARPRAGAMTPERQDYIRRLAKSALENPETLKELNADDSGLVLAELQRQDSPIANVRKEKAAQLQQEVRDALTDLDVTPGKAGAVGWPSLDPRSWPRAWGGRPPAGSPQAAFQYKVNQIVNLMTLPRLELMRGTGPLSNADIEMLRRSATTLSTATDEASFNRELSKLKRAFGMDAGGLSADEKAEVDAWEKAQRAKRGGG